MKRFWIIEPGDRFTGSFNMGGTESLRAASSKFLSDFGNNAQNVPELLRRCITAPEGYNFIQSDQSGAEARVVAYESNDRNYIECFEYGVKPHVIMALNIFIDRFRGKEPKSRYYFKRPSELVALPEWKILEKLIKDTTDAYALGKMTCHASNYRMRWRTFQIAVLEFSKGTIRLTQKEAQAMLDAYYVLFPRVQVWQCEIENQVTKNGVLYNAFGHPRFFNRRITDAYIRTAISYVPQSTVGVLAHQAAIAIMNNSRIQELPIYLNANIQDALLIAIPEEYTEEVQQIQEQALTTTLTTTDFKRTYTMQVESNVGKIWAKHALESYVLKLKGQEETET